MTNLQLKMIRCIGAAGTPFLLSNLALDQPQNTEMQGGQTNRVVIEYIEPIISEFRDVYQVLKTYHTLERVQKILSPMRLPEELVVKTTECGQVNAATPARNCAHEYFALANAFRKEAKWLPDPAQRDFDSASC